MCIYIYVYTYMRGDLMQYPGMSKSTRARSNPLYRPLSGVGTVAHIG